MMNRVLPIFNSAGETIHSVVGYPITLATTVGTWFDKQVVNLTNRLPKNLAEITRTTFRSSPFIAARLLLPIPICVTIVISTFAYQILSKAPESKLRYPLTGTAIGCLCCTAGNIAHLVTAISLKLPLDIATALCEFINNLAIAYFLIHAYKLGSEGKPPQVAHTPPSEQHPETKPNHEHIFAGLAKLGEQPKPAGTAVSVVPPANQKQ